MQTATTFHTFTTPEVTGRFWGKWSALTTSTYNTGNELVTSRGQRRDDDEHLRRLGELVNLSVAR